MKIIKVNSEKLDISHIKNMKLASVLMEPK